MLTQLRHETKIFTLLAQYQSTANKPKKHYSHYVLKFVLGECNVITFSEELQNIRLQHREGVTGKKCGKCELFQAFEGLKV